MKSVPFDQFQRYNNAKLIIESLRGENNKFKILEVGANEHQLLEKFLPEDDIKYLDIHLPEHLRNHPKYILGDATNMHFDDNEYDIIIALDVFEHISSDKRNMFIKEIDRVAKEAFIIGAPFKNDEVSEAEIRLNELFRTLHGENYIWIEEHIQNGLPDLKETLKLLDEMKCDYKYFGHGNLGIWERITKLHFLSIIDKDLIEFRENIDDYYNKHLFLNDYTEDSYRKFIIVYKNIQTNGKLEFLDNIITKQKMEKFDLIESEFNILMKDKFFRRERHEIVSTLKNFISEQNQGMVETINYRYKEDLEKENAFVVYSLKDKTEKLIEIAKIYFKETQRILNKDVALELDIEFNKIRIEFSNKPVLIKIVEFKAVFENGEVVDLSLNMLTNGKFLGNNKTYLFSNDNPYLELGELKYKKFRLIFQIEYISYDLSIHEIILNAIHENCNLEKKMTEYEKYLNSTLEHVNKLEKIIYDRNDQIIELEDKVERLKFKGKIKNILRKIGITRSNIVYRILREPELIKKGILEIRRNGISGLAIKMKVNKMKDSIDEAYTNKYPNTLDEIYNKEDILNQISNFRNKPLLSIIIPVYNVDPKWIDLTIKSIERQTYEKWEICLADDASSNADTVRYLKELSNSKIKLCRLEKNSGISNASNAAFDIASGDYIILMDNDDELREEALFEVVKTINNCNPDIIYSDEDKIDMNGKRKFPFLKPDWSPDLLYSQMYICHLLIFKKELFDLVGGFRSDFDGSQDYDLMLRMSEVTQSICHIPKVLYSWRELPTSTSINPGSKPYAHEAGLRSLNEHLKRKYGPEAYAQETKDIFVYDSRYFIDKNNVKVSVIIPTKDKVELLERCIRSIIDKTTYENYEILILNNNSQEKMTYEWFEKTKNKYSDVKVIDAFYEFNWSKLNNHGIRESTGDVYIFLNNDTEVISPDWMERLAENAIREDIGTVGALLLYEDGTIQHAGVVLGMGGWADHVFKGMKPVHFGSPFVSPVLNRNVLANTGACLAISKQTIEKIGNFNEDFIICGSDVEISLRARKHGLNNLYNARVKLYHLESKSRDSFIPEIDFEMSKKHYREHLISGDPYYNLQLDINSSSPTIKF
ncbi:MAG: glycosyltransferase [Erysipelotrichia bacterium]|nr:glycosyltransferase [Erysipelotrichia bacterium]